MVKTACEHEQDVLGAQYARAAVRCARHLPVEHARPGHHVEHTAIGSRTDDRDFKLYIHAEY